MDRAFTAVYQLSRMGDLLWRQFGLRPKLYAASFGGAIGGEP